VCFFNRFSSTPESCKFPPPLLDGLNATVWDLFQSLLGSASYSPMSGFPLGQDPMSVRVMAEGFEIGWCWAVTWRWRLIHATWLAHERALWEARQKRK